MRKFVQYLLKRPLTWMANTLAAAPKKETVLKSLSELYKQGLSEEQNAVKTIEVSSATDKFIVFSDQHKGNRTWADDFKLSELNYLVALKKKKKEGFHFINLGDSEEGWKFNMPDILSSNEAALAAESAFSTERYTKTFGNHDIIWKDKFAVDFYLKKYFHPVPVVYEAAMLKFTDLELPLKVFLTHGHQGDLMSDNNAVSTWIVAHIWMPLQRFLRINVNSASKDFSLKNLHNKFMYEWGRQQENMLLVTGHTHSPVFASGRYFSHPNNDVHHPDEHATLRPVYFNTGCCCFDDGDITGIEIADGFIRLIKWYDEEHGSRKMVLEEISLQQLLKDLQPA